tara:strand:- start:11717 stop:14413 length:2697 start_codon:yes stop_codon:yes gene_type:complete
MDFKTKKVTKFQNIIAPLWGALLVLSLVSCSEITELPQEGTRVDKLDTTFYDTGKGYVYRQSPFDANGYELPRSATSVDGWISTDFITTNNELFSSCAMQVETGFFTTTAETVGETVNDTDNCFRVLNDDDADTIPLQAINAGWNYPIKSQPDGFYQVNGFYHSNLIIKKFLEALYLAHSTVHFPMGSNSVYPVTKFDFHNTLSFWFSDAGNEGVSRAINVYTKQPITPINAYFNGAKVEIGMGYDPDQFITTPYSMEDLSVFYHEYGHAFAYILMNQRNIAVEQGTLPLNYHAPVYKSTLGKLFYDEAGAINEGIADFFAYFITNRAEMGEWAFNGFARPMTETSDNHSANVSKQSGERLKYPDFAYYLSGSDEPDEDVHNAGQIISHYLVSLTESFKNTCTSIKNLSSEDDKHEKATALTIMLLSETLGELGDMTARGSDVFDTFIKTGSDPYLGRFFTNLNAFESYLWGHSVNPPTFRRFAKLIGKNIKYRISNSACPSFSVDDSEQLLDEYGLLLFDSYNETAEGTLLTGSTTAVTANDADTDDFSGQSITFGLSNYSAVNDSSINELNRKQTVLVSKEFIDLPTEASGEPPIFIFDKQEGIRDLLSSLTFEGQNVTISEGLAGPEYNNGNIKISPGEIIGITPNLFNFSNSNIGGVRVLANDWDHMKLDVSTENHVNTTQNLVANEDIAMWKPCQIDGFPLVTENGIAETPGSEAEGDCLFTTKHNQSLTDTATTPEYYPDSPQPVCFVQFSDENETKWVSQDFFRSQELLLEDDECLNGPSMSGNNFNPNECLVRVLPGGSHAVFGKIDAQKTWQKTLQGDGSAATVSSNHILVMEINKLIRPGTTFNCRFRATFSNCSDCFEDENGDEYPDYEYAGSEPFKIINFSFKVLD